MFTIWSGQYFTRIQIVVECWSFYKKNFYSDLLL